jgi:hypothetical protein
MLTDFRNKYPSPPLQNEMPETLLQPIVSEKYLCQISERIRTVIYVFVGFSPVGDGADTISRAVLCLPSVSQDILRRYSSIVVYQFMNLLQG